MNAGDLKQPLFVFILFVLNREGLSRPQDFGWQIDSFTSVVVLQPAP